MKDIMVKAKKKEGMFVAATEGGKSGVPAVRVFHEHAKIYDSWYENSLVFAIELAALQSLQTVMKGPGIEIGVGPGRFAREIGLEFGLDPAWKPLVLACRRGIQCCQGVGEQLPLRDRAMGRIYLLFTLCFTRDPQKVLAECCRCLRDDGHLVIGMIPAGGEWGKLLAAKKTAGHLFYKHANLYTTEELQQWLAGAGLVIREKRSTLYQAPDHPEKKEAPRNILDERAGFVVILAGKGYGQDHNTDD
jgi:ubiquinone/menaquinone biosynthesis C-methylase UbiE